MRRPGSATVVLGWLLACALWSSPAPAEESGPLLPGEFDLAALESELTRPLAELGQQGSEALRFHVQRLTEFSAALDEAHGIAEADRRAMRDRILARVVQIGQQARADGASSARGARASDRRAAARESPDTRGGALGVLGENSILLVGLLGGLIVAYSLGRLAGYRRGASEASYYGAGDPRLWFTARARESAKPAAPLVRITLDRIRSTLAGRRAVLLQLGYEIAPGRREEFLGLIRKVDLALNHRGDHVYSAWEDPRHPNRFYEVVVCRRLETLELLTSDRSELAELDAGIEACWRPGRPILRRAWWRILPERDDAEAEQLVSASSDRSREDRVP